MVEVDDGGEKGRGKRRERREGRQDPAPNRTIYTKKARRVEQESNHELLLEASQQATHIRMTDRIDETERGRTPPRLASPRLTSQHRSLGVAARLRKNLRDQTAPEAEAASAAARNGKKTSSGEHKQRQRRCWRVEGVERRCRLRHVEGWGSDTGSGARRKDGVAEQARGGREATMAPASTRGGRDDSGGTGARRDGTAAPAQVRGGGGISVEARREGTTAALATVVVVSVLTCRGGDGGGAGSERREVLATVVRNVSACARRQRRWLQQRGDTMCTTRVWRRGGEVGSTELRSMRELLSLMSSSYR
uniref:Uncharacterized protein n=1 Tax=Oryza punctata TaxID=4537 RepID=A0A0E0MLG9_ORYPU